MGFPSLMDDGQVRAGELCCDGTRVWHRLRHGAGGHIMDYLDWGLLSAPHLVVSSLPSSFTDSTRCWQTIQKPLPYFSSRNMAPRSPQAAHTALPVYNGSPDRSIVQSEIKSENYVRMNHTHYFGLSGPGLRSAIAVAAGLCFV